MVVSVGEGFVEEFECRLKRCRELLDAAQAHCADDPDTWWSLAEEYRDALEWVATELEDGWWIGLDADTILDRCNTRRCGIIHI